MQDFATYLTGIRTKARGGGALLLLMGIGLWVFGKLNPGEDYSQVVVGGALFTCGTLLFVLAETANMIGGLARALREPNSSKQD